MCLALMVRLSFTYNDHIMHELGREFDQRNVAIAVPLKAVKVAKSTPVEYDGEYLYPNKPNSRLSTKRAVMKLIKPMKSVG